MYPHLQLPSPQKAHYAHYSHAIRSPSMADIAITLLANGTHPIAFHHHRLGLGGGAVLLMTMVLFLVRVVIVILAIHTESVSVAPTAILAGKWWVTGYVRNLRSSLGDISRLVVPRLSLESFLVDTLFHQTVVHDEKHLLQIRRSIKSLYGVIVLVALGLIIVAWVKTRHLKTMKQYEEERECNVPLWICALLIPMDPSLAISVMSLSRSFHFFAYILYFLSGVSTLVAVVGGGGTWLTCAFLLVHSIPYVLAIWQWNMVNSDRNKNITIAHGMI